MSGKFNIDVTFRELPAGDIIMQTSGVLENIDVAQMFDQFENFDQSTLTSKILKVVLQLIYMK
ncbi:MAG: hypothetical protein IPJ60_02125 [Sphingobacteriaceae bacterium]|nr:hypothetical protein [Sphingobacteriaceae bacterium]